MLNCQVGDLAITVDAELTENSGNNFCIVADSGYCQWGGLVKSVFVLEEIDNR